MELLIFRFIKETIDPNSAKKNGGGLDDSNLQSGFKQKRKRNPWKDPQVHQLALYKNKF
jgi:hypothetical protein